MLGLGEHVKHFDITVIVTRDYDVALVGVRLVAAVRGLACGPGAHVALQGVGLGGGLAAAGVPLYLLQDPSGIGSEDGAGYVRIVSCKISFNFLFSIKFDFGLLACDLATSASKLGVMGC